MVDLSAFDSGRMSNSGVNATSTPEDIATLPNTARITMALNPDTDMTDMVCASLSGNFWQIGNGCEIVSYNDTHVTIETTHFSYFTIKPAKTNRVIPPPFEPTDDSTEDCGESIAPIFILLIITIAFVILAAYGWYKDKQHKDWPYNTIPVSEKATMKLKKTWK